jgi:ribose transport system ATP-binding protein/inositol transport system ATP-binding protein
MQRTEVLRAERISKAFPGVQALKNVDLSVYQGEVHALIGENGAGKSTLIKIFAGIYKPDGGDIYIDGKKVELQDVATSRNLGISVIHQELCLATNMKVYENILLGREPVRKGLFRFVDNREAIRYAQEVLDRLELTVDARAEVGHLSVAKQQMVEIAKAISFKARIVIMDEPTSSISTKEADKLFETIRRLKTEGVSIIYISHRLQELDRIADRVTVLRDGEKIDCFNFSDKTRDQIINLMVGRDLKDVYPPIPKSEHIEEMFRAEGITSDKVTDISFSVQKGEILGFFGLVGSGRTELMSAIFGLEELHRGQLFIEGKPVVIHSPGDAMSHGLALVPEDRKKNGLVLKQDVRYNISLCVYNQIIHGIWVDGIKQNQLVSKYIEELSIKTPSADQLTANLSGGNQQKVVLAKWLAAKPKILILDEPTRGIDVGAKSEIYSIMTDLAENGMGIIFISSELPEIANLCNRVMIMYEGRIAGEITDRERITQENIIDYALGGAQK